MAWGGKQRRRRQNDGTNDVKRDASRAGGAASPALPVLLLRRVQRQCVEASSCTISSEMLAD